VGVFEELHADRITGSLAMFDRMIFKGYLTRLYPPDIVRAPSGDGVAIPSVSDRAREDGRR
jgi:hypothetical protein